MKQKDRFIVLEREGNSFSNAGHREVLVDRETGVCYLVWHGGGYAGGITPLLNADGTPVVRRDFLRRI